MKIKVKSLQGDEYIVDVEIDQPVSSLKLSVSEKAGGLPVERQKLVYKGRTMQDSKPLSEYNIEEGAKVHLILQKENTPLPTQTSPLKSTSSPMDTSTTSMCSRVQEDLINTTSAGSSDSKQRPQSRFEVILRERLAKYFSSDAVEKIMTNLHHEIKDDINSSSLDDLERLAKQKLNISNE